MNLVAEATLEISSKDGESVRMWWMRRPDFRRSLFMKAAREPVDQVFSDWREVNGLRLPFQWTMMQGDKKFASTTIPDYKINSG